MVWGCLLLFGPCFFIAGICTYPMAMARRIANEAYNATVDYESLGAVCTVRKLSALLADSNLFSMQQLRDHLLLR